MGSCMAPNCTTIVRRRGLSWTSSEGDAVAPRLKSVPEVIIHSTSPHRLAPSNKDNKMRPRVPRQRYISPVEHRSAALL